MDSARSIAHAGRLHEETITTSILSVRAYTRLSHLPPENAHRHAPVHVYLEGDGHAWLSRYDVAKDPSPINPLALRLAAIDPAPDVIYLARPCQYTTDPRCHPAHWTDARYGEDIVTTYMQALDQLKERRGTTTSFILIGHSGGGAIAALLAQRRHDIRALVTVAGILNHDLWTAHHGVSPLSRSLNPAMASAALVNLPQTHFCGEQDDVVPCALSDRMLEPFHHTALRRLAAGHENGWAKGWPDLLKTVTTTP